MPLAKSSEDARQRIGIISDTHGVLRPEAVAFLRGCRHIFHAGDIGSARVLEELAGLAPITAVRGNNDVGEWAQRLPESETVCIAGVAIHVLHDIGNLRHARTDLRAQVVISGHSHRPAIAKRDDVLFVNPGSAGPRRFKLPVSLAELIVAESGAVDARIHELAVTAVRVKKSR